MLHVVVMAGGSGTRFWPRSRRKLPKQLLALAGDRSLLQQTIDRAPADVSPDRVWVVTNTAQLSETARQAPHLPAQNLLAEPCGRNTAPCVGLAAIHALHSDPEATLLVMPADHVIRPTETFRAAVDQARGLIEADPARFVLFGVRPAFASTGFGYIERGRPLASTEGAYEVASFREKPVREVAQQYVDGGRHYWNCGIFVWRAARILHALRDLQPEIAARLERLSAAIGTPRYAPLLEAEFPQMTSISIDHAVLEKAGNVCVLAAPFEWDDVGSWQALPRLLGADADGNTVTGRWCGVDTRDCIVQSTGDHLLATVGLVDCIIVHTPDATLVARKDDEHGLRALVARLEELGHGRNL